MKKIISLFIVIATVVSAICVSTSTIAALRGDINADGNINNKDVVILFRYVSGGSADYDPVYDFNKDKAINNKDVVALFRAVSSGDLPTDEITDKTETEPTEASEPAEEPDDDETSADVSDDISEEESSAEEETTEDLGEFIVVPDSEAELYIPRVIGDHMVIQRDQKIKVWGTSNKDGALVRGTFMGDTALGKVKNGEWEITFSPKDATYEPQVLTVEDSCGNTLMYSDILVGDVYVVGGQSNAEASSKDIPECYRLMKFGANKPLRIFRQGAKFVIDNPELAANPCDDIINPEWAWSTAIRKAGASFSLLGWFMGDKLASSVDVPIGVVSIAASGAALSELMPKELYDSLGIKAGTNRYYNALIHPFLKMKFTAMIFCQGESESMMAPSTPAADYAENFEALMNELRHRWGFDFPIYNIQLSDYTSRSTQMKINDEYNAGYVPNTGVVRAQQYTAYTEMEGVRLIPSYDLGPVEGYGNFLHPPYKKELGERVADLILADIYGIGSPDAALAPEPVEIKMESASPSSKTIEIKFKNVGEGLKSTDGSNTVTGFVYGRTKVPSSGMIKTAAAEIISSDTVRLTVNSAAKSLYIGYACEAHVPKDAAKLVNSYGLPVLAFNLAANGKIN